MENIINYIKTNINPKYSQAAILTGYALVAREFYNFEKSHFFTIMIIAFSILIDQLISYAINKKFRLNLTPVIIGLACSLLIDTSHLWVYLVAVLASHISKLIFKVDNKHIYNPAAFGVAFSLLFFNDLVSGNLNLFNGDAITSGLFFMFGLFNVVYARMYKISLFWLLFFLILNIGNNLIEGALWQVPLLIMLNPSFLIFTFHMISDPKTIPNKKIWLVALVYAIIDFILRTNKYPNSFFYSIILGQSLIVLFNKVSLPKNKLSKLFPISIIAIFSYKLITLHYQHPDIIQHKYPKYINKVYFKEANKKLGINFKHKDPDRIINDMTLARTYVFNGSVAIGDINNDGWKDFFVVTSDSNQPNHLYLNNKGKGFIEVAKKWGVDLYKGDPKSRNLFFNVSSTLFDYDNDGDLDLYISRIGCDLLYENKGSSFSLKEDKLFCKNTKYAFPFDYDNDGDFDLLLIRYLPKNYLLTEDEVDIEPPQNSFDAQNATKNLILINNNKELTIHEDQYISEDSRYSFDATIIDPYNNGKFYLALINDFGTNRYYDMSDNYKIKEDLYENDRRNSMNVHSHFQTNETRPEVYISNIFMKDFYIRGNFLYKIKENNYSYDIANKNNVNKCGWAWGGVFNDYNLDGYNDLYVTNGLLSLDKFKNLNQNNQSYSFVLYKNFSKSQLQLLGVHRKDFSERDNTFWALLAAASFQKDCLFIYDPKEKEYINVSDESGIKTPWDGRSVGAIDYDNDGDLDLIVAMQNQELKFLENTVNDLGDKNWIGIDLQSKNFTNKIGTKVIITQGKNTYRKEFTYGKSGLMSRSDERIHFGLISNEDVEITIVFPDQRNFSFKRKVPIKKYYTFNLDLIDK